MIWKSRRHCLGVPTLGKDLKERLKIVGRDDNEETDGCVLFRVKRTGQNLRDGKVQFREAVSVHSRWS